MSANDFNHDVEREGSTSASQARVDNLLERLCDQLLTDEELAELDALLSCNKSLRQCYLRYISLHNSLESGVPAESRHEPCESLCSDSEVEFRNMTIPWLVAARRTRRLALGLVGVAAVAAATMLVAFFLIESTPRSVRPAEPPNLVDDIDMHRETQAVARVTLLSSNVVWESPNESIPLRSNVHEGQSLKLSHGEMVITYATGVELRLLAPAEFVVAQGGGSLRRGGLRAVVPDKGRGFTIETPHGKVVDLGTEFGVAVDDFGVAEVSVFRGIVDMFPIISGGGGGTVRLSEGEAVQWNSETLVRMKADPARFGSGIELPTGEALKSLRPVIDEDLTVNELTASNWLALGGVDSGESLELSGNGAPAEKPYLISTRQFPPMDGPIAVVCDIRFIEIDPDMGASFALLTRSAEERDAEAPEDWRTTHTCVRCSLRASNASSTSLVETATKLDRDCPLTNMAWRGFDGLEEQVPYRLVMIDDGVNVSFTVSLRHDPSITKTVTCRSLYRGKENFIAIEGPVNGVVAVDRIQVLQSRTSNLQPTAKLAFSSNSSLKPIAQSVIDRRLAEMAPANARLVIEDDFHSNSLDPGVWTTLESVEVTNGRVRLGKPNAEEHINTFASRPYLVTRQRYTPRDGTLTILGSIEFDKNFLNEWGGSFAVMSRADNQLGNGPGWEYSVLRRGVRFNFWPAAWGQEHSLEIHEKPSPSMLSLLVAQGLEINPESRDYLFKMVDDGETATLTIEDAHDPAICGTISAPTDPELRIGHIGFEGCWGCPVWLDDIRIYRTPKEASP